MSSGPTLGDSLAAIGPRKEAFRAWFFQSQATSAGSGTGVHSTTRCRCARPHGVKVIVTLANQWGDCEPGRVQRRMSWYTSGYRQRDPGAVASYRDG